MLKTEYLLLQKPVFVPGIHIEIEGDHVYLSLDNNFAVLSGGLGLELVPLIERAIPLEKIVANMCPPFEPEEVYLTFMRLVGDGFIMEGNLGMSNDVAGFWTSLGYQSSVVHQTLSSEKVGLIELGFKQGDVIKSLLEEMGIEITDRSERNVVVVSTYLDTRLSKLDQEAKDKGQSFLLCKLMGPAIWIGPVIGSDTGFCWKCLARSIKLNHPAYAYNLTKKAIPPEFPLPPQPILKLAGGMVALETVKWLSSPKPYFLDDTLISFDLRSLNMEQHSCRRKARCSVCGIGHLNEKKDLVIKRKIVNKTNNFRSVSAKETVLQYENLVSPITGIIRSLKRVEQGSNEHVHNYTASHSSRFKRLSIESLRLATRDQSGGKGKTNVESKASGLCEALERFSAIYDDDPVDELNSYNQISKDAIHPNDMLLLSDKQLETRLSWNREQRGYFQYVPERFDETDNIAWTKVHSLTYDSFRLVPTSYCYYGFDGPGMQYCKGDSNGLASGNNLEEAILYGILELAERDAVSIWWYNQIQYPSVDLESFNDPYFKSIKEYLKQLGRDLWVLDLTNDLEIPTFVAVSPDYARATQDILLGFGAHFDAQTAITRAILEVNQSLPSVSTSIAERREHLYPEFADALDWWQTATIENQYHLRATDSFGSKSSVNYISIESVNLKERIHLYIERFALLGLETLVLDLTRPDIGLSVVRVIVPGLRHFWRRLAPGRLYEVPVELGWVNESNTEESLNPISMFL